MPSRNGSQSGEVLSPIPGEMRLQSDFELARGMSLLQLYRHVDNINDDLRPKDRLSLAGHDQRPDSHADAIQGRHGQARSPRPEKPCRLL